MYSSGITLSNRYCRRLAHLTRNSTGMGKTRNGASMPQLQAFLDA
jgi:hypothetical protein